MLLLLMNPETAGAVKSLDPAAPGAWELVGVAPTLDELAAKVSGRTGSLIVLDLKTGAVAGTFIQEVKRSAL